MSWEKGVKLAELLRPPAATIEVAEWTEAEIDARVSKWRRSMIQHGKEPTTAKADRQRENYRVKRRWAQLKLERYYRDVCNALGITR